MSLPRTVHVATADTRHFTFEGFGATAAEAERALRDAYAVHAAQTGADPNLLDGEGDVHVRQVALGAGYRDREPIHQPDPADAVQAAHLARRNATQTLVDNALGMLFAKVLTLYPTAQSVKVEDDGDNGRGGFDLRIVLVETDEDDVEDDGALDALNDFCGHELAMLADADPNLGNSGDYLARPTA